MISSGQMFGGRASVAEATSSPALLFCTLPPAATVIRDSFRTSQFGTFAAAGSGIRTCTSICTTPPGGMFAPGSVQV